MKKLAIFASGAGSNALNLLEEAKTLSNLEIATVVVDTETSPLPEILKDKFPSVSVERILPDFTLKGTARKAEHEFRILQHLFHHNVEWILLAGYMRIIGPTLLSAFENHIVNIHPSLLPLYPGVDSYRRAFEDGVSESGVTVHLVDAGVDTGPIVLQESFARREGDTLADFVQRGKEIEWRLYPKILQMINEWGKL